MAITFALTTECFAAQVPARAASTLNRAEQTIANFSFATQLESGIYAINGRTVQIYRLPSSWELGPATEEQTGVAILLPVTLGFYDFKLEDVLHTQLPRNWRISSFVQAGSARNERVPPTS